jgi:hypothetical protein
VTGRPGEPGGTDRPPVHGRTPASSSPEEAAPAPAGRIRFMDRQRVNALVAEAADVYARRGLTA